VQPIARPRADLVDLLDRVLDRGLVLEADVIVCLAGVPLIGIRLRAALAGVETMVRHGLMGEWDQGIRQASRTDRTVAAAIPVPTVRPRLEHLPALQVADD